MANNTERDIVVKGHSYPIAKAVASGSTVAAPAALTSSATQGGAYAQAENQKLRDDIANLRTTVAAMHTALVNAGLLPT